jgi:SulP family sulfate permease
VSRTSIHLHLLCWPNWPKTSNVGTDTVVVVTGSVCVSRSDSDGAEIRLRTLCAGAIVGEIGLLNGDTRTATIPAESDVVLQVLTSAVHQRLRVAQPSVVIEFYGRVLCSTADRAAEIHRSLTQSFP